METIETRNRNYFKEIFVNFSRDYAIVFAIVLLGIIFGITSPSFFTRMNLTNILLQTSTIAIVAMGQATIVLTGNMDLSLGQCVCLCGYVAAFSMEELSINPWLSLIFGVLTGCLVGAISGFLYAYAGIPAFIATLGMQNVCRGCARMITGAKPISGLPGEVGFLAREYVLDIIPSCVIIMAAIFILMQFIYSRTKFGRQIYAVGGNAEAAFFAGINTKAVYFSAFLLGGFFTGLGSMVLLSRLDSANSTNGNLYEFDAMIGCVLGGISMKGGKGKVIGAFFGVFFLIMFFNGMTMLNVNSFIQDVLKGVALILAIAIDVFRNQRSAKVSKKRVAK